MDNAVESKLRVKKKVFKHAFHQHKVLSRIKKNPLANEETLKPHIFFFFLILF
jgi:hypothetical protein